MRWCRLPRSKKSLWSGYPGVTLLAAGALAGCCAGAWAQSSRQDDLNRFAVPTVDPETSGPMSGFRRQIDPDSERDPFAEDRARERDDRRRERDRDDDTGSDAAGNDEPPDPLEDGAERQEEDPDGESLRIENNEAQTDDARAEAEALVDSSVSDAEETLTGAYDPVGIRLGSFLLFPELTTETLYTDNVLITTTNPQSDHALVLTPRLKAQSNWSRHYLEGNFGAVQSYYSEFDIQNENAYDINLLGRLDVMRRTQIEATALHERTLEDIDDVSAVDGAADRTPIITTGGTTELRHRFNRLTASLRGGITEFDYEDVPLIGGGIANNDDRDYTERKLTGRLSYEFQPGFSTFVEGSGNTREFAFRTDDDGIIRGSDGNQVLAGVALDLGAKLTGEMAAGYARQTPDETSFDDIAGFIFDAALRWRPSELTTVNFRAGSEIQETTLVDSPGSLLRTAELSVEHALRRNLIAGVSLGYAEEEYEGIDQVDRDYIFGLNGEYLLNRSMALVASYEHINSTRNVPDSDTIENLFRFGVRLRR